MRKIFTLTTVCALLLISLSVNAQNGLFISEVADPADEYTGRFIELFNAGSEAVDFNTDVFFLARQSNGGSSWGEVQLTGSIAAGSTYVIGGSAFESWYGFAPDLVTGILTGNGDDPYSLYEGGDHETGMLHDIYGDEDTDGTGEPWEYTDSRAVRTPDVDDPRILWSASEWVITPADISDCDPGTHHGSDPIHVVPGDFSLRIVSDTIESGTEVVLAVAVGELTTEDDIISYQIDFAYDASILDYSYASVIGTLADGGTLADNPVTGMVSISYMNTEPIVGSGTILLLHFSTLELGTADLQLSHAILNNIPVTELYNGEVLITETAPPSAKISYSDSINRLADMLQITATFSEEMDLTNPVLLNMAGAVRENEMEMVRLSDTTYSVLYAIPRAEGIVSVSLSGGTDLWGNEVEAAPTSGETFSIIGLRPGDVNDDGEVQAYDAALTLQHSVGLDPLPVVDALPWENWRDSTANVNMDDAITAYDAGLILQYSAGIITNFSGGVKKAASFADVSVEVDGDRIILYSYGNVIGLNISTRDSGKMIGHPRVLLGNSASQASTEFITASNIEDSEYRFGICTTKSPIDGSAILEIPVINQGTLILDLIVNDVSKSVPLDLISGDDALMDHGISVYPNPAFGKLFIDGLEGSGKMKILNLNGQVVTEEILDLSYGSIDLTGLSPGMYVIRIDTREKTVFRKFIKK